MRTHRTTPDKRRHAASEALEALGSRRGKQQRLSVQCRHGHHLATVYETPTGLVVTSLTGPHSHGSKDRVDTTHHAGKHGVEYVDLLTPTAGDDDLLPAWCDCGPRNLSRSELRAAVKPGQKTLHLP